ncbi:MAG: 4'-phosphopantetheinyl transferase superfamily protein [Rhodospirillales bacterium]|nr:4'-phosphopantetheinyl transferase superfamily protein [Rhodospirillales bacterium]
MSYIRVYRADLGQLCAEACLSVLSDAERRQASHMTNQSARHEFVTARALLRQLLSRHTGEPAGTIEFAAGPCGKPALRGAHGVHFNLSHSHGMALVAVASAEVGIDIERIDKDVDYDDIAETMFSAAEIGMLRSAPASRRGEVFFSIWTRKEAYLKATGLGLSSNLPEISTASPQGVIEDHGGSSDDHAWHAFDLPAPANFKAALVTAAKQCEIEIVDVTNTARLDLNDDAGGDVGHMLARLDSARGDDLGAL